MKYIRNIKEELVGVYDDEKGDVYGFNKKPYIPAFGNKIAEDVEFPEEETKDIVNINLEESNIVKQVRGGRREERKIQNKNTGEVHSSLHDYLAKLGMRSSSNPYKVDTSEKPIPAAKELVKKEYDYRILINPRDNSAQYIKVDKGLTFTEEELINYAFNIGHKSIRVINKSDMPNYKGKLKKNSVKKGHLEVERNIPPFMPSDFTAKTNHLFDTPISLPIFKSLYSSRITQGEFADSIKDSTCLKNVMLSNHANSLSVGVSTGKIVNNSIEIIGLTLGRMGGLSKTSNYNKLYLSLDDWRKINSSHFMYLFRFKLISDKFTLQNFGSGPNIKKSFGRLFGAGEVEVEFGFNYTKDIAGNTIDVAIIRIGGNRYTIDMRDLEFYSINSKSLISNKIKKTKEIIKGSPAVVSDDRRLKSFKKGDFVTVSSIMKDKSNLKNSQVKITNGEKVETVLLKQVKYYDNQKEDIGKSKPTKKESVQLSTEEISYTLPF